MGYEHKGKEKLWTISRIDNSATSIFSRLEALKMCWMCYKRILMMLYFLFGRLENFVLVEVKFWRKIFCAGASFITPTTYNIKDIRIPKKFYPKRKLSPFFILSKSQRARDLLRSSGGFKSKLSENIMFDYPRGKLRWMLNLMTHEGVISGLHAIINKCLIANI